MTHCAVERRKPYPTSPNPTPLTLPNLDLPCLTLPLPEIPDIPDRRTMAKRVRNREGLRFGVHGYIEDQKTQKPKTFATNFLWNGSDEKTRQTVRGFNCIF